MANTSHAEFDLHVWKKTSDDNKPDVYTIGVWDRGQILSVCHIEPIDAALSAIRNLLEQREDLYRSRTYR